MSRCRVALAQTLISTEAVFNPPSPPICNQLDRLCGAPHNRRNWLFFGSDDGGRRLATLASFTATCQQFGLNPWVWLKETLTRLPNTPAEQLATLLPMPTSK